jgi:hypothetical protein
LEQSQTVPTLSIGEGGREGKSYKLSKDGSATDPDDIHILNQKDEKYM